MPVAVLSNNDGCIIARSTQVKKLGVPMGCPYFKVEKLLTAHNVRIFSANFRLYGDFSRRVVSILEQFSPNIEVYSVDESFLDISSLGLTDYAAWAEGVHARVKKWTGIPTAVGVAPTKTLAKLSADYAKTHRPGFTLSVHDEQTRREVLQGSSVEDIWGIGRRLGPRLKGFGIRTAWDLACMPERWAQEQLTIRGLRIVKELNGESCIPLTESVYADDHQQKSIASTRSFGHSIHAVHELEAAIASFAARASAKLRRRKQLAWELTAFMRTGKQRYQEGYFARPGGAYTVKLPYPTADTGLIVHWAIRALHEAHDPELAYRKAGVILTKLVPQEAAQLSLIDPMAPRDLERRESLMRAMDRLNGMYGRGVVQYAIQGVRAKQRWHSRQERKSRAYTTSWYQLPRVRG